jgi:type IV/VI secretion system ImpK/VasF family protein
MDNHAKRDPLLMEPYQQVHYALVALADEIVLTSGWEHSPAWRQALLEERFYNSQHAGSRFFELANALDDAPQDVVAIFYLCLALGFSGRYAPADHELAEVKEKLLARLPSKPRIMEEPSKALAQKNRRIRGGLWGTAVVAFLLAAIAFGWNQWQVQESTQPGPAPAPAVKTAPEAPAAQPKALAKADFGKTQQSAAPAESEKSSQAKTKPTPSPEQTAKPAAKAKAEPESVAQVKPGEAPTPTSQPKAETGTTASSEPKTTEQEAAPQPAAQAKAEKPPAQAPQPPPAAQEKAAATVEQPKAPAAAPQPEKAQATAKSKATAKEKSFRVRVGVYVGPIQSGRFADQLKEAGFPTSVEKLDRANGKVLYVVSITPLPSLAEAERIRSEVKSRFNVQGVIKEN